MAGYLREYKEDKWEITVELVYNEQGYNELLPIHPKTDILINLYLTNILINI